MTAQTVVGIPLLGLGVLLIGLAAIGLVRLPDVYARANAVAKAAGLGVVCVLLGVAVNAPTPAAAVTLLVAALLQLVTVPISGYALGEAAWLSRAPLVGTTRHDRPDEPPAPGGDATG